MPRRDIAVDIPLPQFEDEEAVVRVYNGVDYSRQMGLFNPFEYQDTMISVVGAGAVGSFTVLTLAKMGFRNFIVWDDDVVDSKNLPNQFYAMHHIGMKKVDALKDIVKMFTGLDIETRDMRWSEAEHISALSLWFSANSSNHNVLIMCTDNMASRKLCSEYFAKKLDGEHLFVDARMGGLVYRVYAMRRGAFNSSGKCKYSYAMYTDDSAKQDPCTAKSIIFNVTGIASTIASMVRKALSSDFTFTEVIGNMDVVQVVNANDVTKLM